MKLMKITRIGASILSDILRRRSPAIIRQGEDEWDRQFQQGVWNFLLKEERQPHLDNIYGICCQLVKQETIRVLDVGCGNGALASRFMKDDRFDYTGIDIARTAIDTLRAAYPTFNVHVADLESWVGEQDFYDVIIFAEVLCYVDFQKVLDHYRQYLKRPGTLIVSLHQTWRTRLMWYYIRKKMRTVLDIRVKHIPKKARWTILAGSFKEP